MAVNTSLIFLCLPEWIDVNIISTYGPLHHTCVDLGISSIYESYVSEDALNKMEPFYPLKVNICSFLNMKFQSMRDLGHPNFLKILFLSASILNIAKPCLTVSVFIHSEIERDCGKRFFQACKDGKN